MPFYEQQTVDEVQAANDIVEVIAQYVTLKRAGRHLKGLCPFHQEKTPSFMVNPQKQIFYCFGCHVGGDVFTFLMRYENLTFPEALKLLASRANIRLPETTAVTRKGSTDLDKFYEVYQHAADFYHRLFLHPEDGKAAREYLKKRGFSETLAHEFKIGWAPNGWSRLYEFLRGRGYSEELLLRSGLVQRSREGHCYDYFRNRLVFPIQNLQSKTVAFGGRLIDQSPGPKYLNSAENPIFHKRKELFGLHVAKRFIDRQLPRILITEGYLDFLRLYEQGFKSSVATLGTALTEEHVRILKRFVEEAVVVYDGDAAGQAASLRGLEVFLEGGMNVKIVKMPPGYDPDDFLKSQGVEAFRQLLNNAQDFFDFQLEILLSRYNRTEPLGLMKITNQFLETFVKIRNPILLDHYLKRLGHALGIDENSLRSELAKLRKKTASTAPPSAQKTTAESDVLLGETALQDEIVLMSLILEEESLRAVAVRELDDADFQTEALKALFRQLQELWQQQRTLPPYQILNRLEDENLKTKIVTVWSLEWNDDTRERAFRDCLYKFMSRRLGRQLRELRFQIAKAEKEGDREGVNAYARQYQRLLEQAKGQRR